MLKQALCNPPVLALPNITCNFVVEFNASDMAIRAVLSQNHSHGLRPIKYSSRKLEPIQANYPVHDHELLALFLAY